MTVRPGDSRKALDRWLDELKTVEPPADLRFRVMARIAAKASALKGSEGPDRKLETCLPPAAFLADLAPRGAGMVLGGKDSSRGTEASDRGDDDRALKKPGKS